MINVEKPGTMAAIFQSKDLLGQSDLHLSAWQGSVGKPGRIYL
jgi:hypothetical protein